MDKKIRTNYLYSVLYQILGYIIPLITAPYISRVLGVENIGIVSYSSSIVRYFSLFALLGVSNYGNREIAVHKDNKEELSETFWNIYAVQCCASLFVLLTYLYSYKLFSGNDILIARIQSFYIVGCLLDISWFFFGIENFKITVIRNMIVRCISLILIFSCVHQKEDVWKYALINVMGTVFANVILWINVIKFIKWKKPSLKKILSNIKPILILFIPTLTISFYKIMDKIMLGSISNMTQSGLYENAEKIINIPLGLITALANVMLPRMANIYANGNKELGEKLIRNSMQFSMLLAMPITLGLTAIAPVFVPFYLGSGYEGCIQIMSYLSITIIFISWANVIRAQYLIPNKRDKEYTVSVVCGAIINLIVNCTLIPQYGAAGAAIGTVFAEITVTCTQVLLTRKDVQYLIYIKDSCIYAFAAILMYVGIYSLRNIGSMLLIKLLIQIFAGIAIYFISIWMLKVVLKKGETP